VVGTSGQHTPKNGNKTANINVENFHRSLTTVAGLRMTPLKQQISLIPFSIKKVIILLQQSTF